MKARLFLVLNDPRDGGVNRWTDRQVITENKDRGWLGTKE